MAAYADDTSGEVWMGHEGGPSLVAPDPSLGQTGFGPWSVKNGQQVSW